MAQNIEKRILMGPNIENDISEITISKNKKMHCRADKVSKAEKNIHRFHDVCFFSKAENLLV